MATKEFVKLLEQLIKRLKEAPDKFNPYQRNEEWTKNSFILPLLEGLGWDPFTDINYEDSPKDIEDSLDYVLACQTPIGIEAKALDINPPKDRKHAQIVKGLKQCKERHITCFIWTNGDYWQFYSLNITNAPIYELVLNQAIDNYEEIEYIESGFQIIEKRLYVNNHEIFEQRIRENWKENALPTALASLLNERVATFIKLIRESLPSELDIEDDEIKSFIKSLNLSGSSTIYARKKTRQTAKVLSFPDDWQKLISDIYEPEYSRAKDRFHKPLYFRFGQYLISDQYSKWSKSTTWRHVGIKNEANEKKKSGPVIALFMKWHFIEKAERDDMYQRVEDSLPYLIKLFGS